MLSFFPRGVLDEILNLIESVSEGFPSYSWEDSIREWTLMDFASSTTAAKNRIRWKRIVG